MDQKKIGDVLYVFKNEAYEITADTTATVIYVQEELVPAFKTANSTLASKIKPYNFHVMTATKQEWADYVDATGDAEPTGQSEQTGQSEPTGQSGPTGDSGATSTAEVETTGNSETTGNEEPTGT